MKHVVDELKDNGFRESLQFDLEKSYDEALKNDEFKKLVTDLKVARKFLIKYTSILEKSAVEYSNCLRCNGIYECKNKIEGHAYLPRMVDNKPIFEYKMCKYQEKLNKETLFKKNIYFNHISEDIKNASMEEIYMNDKNRFKVIEYLHKFVKDYQKDIRQKGLYLNGSFGCGKTYLVSAVFNELAKNNYKSAIIFWPEFLVELRSSFTTDFKEKYDYVKTIPLLLIDDIGAENTTEWSRDEILCPLVQYRMENHLTTFFTSNLTIDELEEHFGATKNKVDAVKAKRIIERIKQLTVDMNMISKNLRK